MAWASSSAGAAPRVVASLVAAMVAELVEDGQGAGCTHEKAIEADQIQKIDARMVASYGGMYQVPIRAPNARAGRCVPERVWQRKTVNFGSSFHSSG